MALHKKTLLLFLALVASFSFPFFSHAARLRLSPSSGSFTVGSTFDVAIILDTQGKSVNVLDLSLSFSPDRLQVVSPSGGKSVVGIWTSPPRYDNARGTIVIQGAIPGGLTASNGLVSTITFRARETGSALVKFEDENKVLLDDGKGTDALENIQNAVYEFKLPAPAGPLVVSETHPDQARWVANATAIVHWNEDPSIEGYSYVLNGEPVDVPDDISEGVRKSVAYKNLASGNHYFHIKALRNGVWGGVTHFAILVDTEPPAEFPIEVSPEKKTTSKNPIIRFLTTDRHSGIDHYEYKVIPLYPFPETRASYGEFFIEAESPQVLSSSELGSYDIVVRAYDKAGNFKEAVTRIKIVTPVRLLLESPWLLGSILVIVFLLGYFAWHTKKWHGKVAVVELKRGLPSSIQQQLEELKRYREKYGKALFVFIAAGVLSVWMAGGAQEMFAKNTELPPPFITTVSKSISNDEIFYAGGKADARDLEVIIYLQNQETGETSNYKVVSGEKGDWFYRHDTFLPRGTYLLWAQSKLGNVLSPPSPQIEIQVTPTAIQFGSSRLSYTTLYLFAIMLLFIVCVGLAGSIAVYVRDGRRRQAVFRKEIREAEESVKRGFAVVRRDIEAELAVIHKVKLNKELTMEERQREEVLLKDLAWAERFIGKEVWDVRRVEEM